MSYIATNNANSTLAVGLGGTLLDTTLQIQVADIALFPDINDGGTGSDYTLLTLTDTAGNKEIVRVDRHDNGSASFTIQRAQEGTSVRVWQVGDSVSLRLTAGIVTQTYTHPSQGTGAHAATAISVTPAGNIAAVNVQAALEELDSEKSPTGHTHAASVITFTPTGNISAANVQAALVELDSEKEAADATILKAAAIGVTVQGYDATTLKSAAIGVTVQGYDADTTKNDVSNTFTLPQYGTKTTDNDLSFDIGAAGKLFFDCTPTAGGTLTFTNIPASPCWVTIKLVNNSNYAIAAHANTKVTSSFLATVSATGTYIISGYCDGTNVHCATAGASA